MRIGKPGELPELLRRHSGFSNEAFLGASDITRPSSFETKDSLHTNASFGELLLMFSGIFGHIFGIAKATVCDCSATPWRARLHSFPRRVSAILPPHIGFSLSIVGTAALDEEHSLRATRNDDLESRAKAAFLFGSCTRGPGTYRHTPSQFGAYLKAS